MGAVFFSLDLDLVAQLRTALPLRVFVETGTFRGDTTASMASLFDEVYTIELSEALHRQAQARFKGVRNVATLQGSSPELLHHLASALRDRSVLYWLDAHWCGAQTAGQTQECPLLDEIRAIGALNDQSAILIDDARLFLAPPPAPHDDAHWPLLNEVVEAMKKVAAGHELWVINDVMIFAPPSARAAMVQYSRSRGVDLVKLMELARASGVAR